MADPTCEERIDANLEALREDLREAATNERFREEFLEGLLAVSKTLHYEIEFSWGGPQDYLDVEIDPETKEVMDATYHFLDWFDGAERELREDDLKLIEEVFSYLWEE